MKNWILTGIMAIGVTIGLLGCKLSPNALSTQDVKLIKTVNLTATGQALIVAAGHYMHRPSILFGEQGNPINLAFIRTSKPGNKADVGNAIIGKGKSLVIPGVYKEETTISIIPAGHWSLMAWSSNPINTKVRYQVPSFPFVKLVSFSVKPGEVIYLGNLLVRLAPPTLRQRFTMEVVNKTPWARKELAEKFPQKAAQMIFRNPQISSEVQYTKTK